MPLPLQKSAELFRAIAEYTYDWETWVDAAGQTRWVNAAVTRITGYGVEECLALPSFPLPLALECDRPILERVLSDARAGGSGNDVEFRVRTKAGAERWVAISWQSVRASDQACLGYRTSIRDIEERKQMESELHRLRQKAEALAQARSELLANVSHELRSPAHCIAGFAELLLAAPLGEKERRYVAIIVDQCRSMQRQVDDLLSLTALEAGGVELTRETVDLSALAHALMEAAQPEARARGLSLEAQLALSETLIQADGLRLTQVLRNLIDNALKFTQRGGVTLRVSRTGAGDAARLCCEVIDTGPGMDPDQVQTMLLPFRQGDPGAGRRRSGVGLGLAIVERLVSAMRGSLSIESQPGRGTHVTVLLPWVKAESLDDKPAAIVALPRSGTALVVDDSAVARELLSSMLESCSFSAQEAGSLAEALRAVAERAFDVIFLDYQMPDCDGAEAALALRERVGPDVPIFVLTANAFVHEGLREARSAVDGVLTKPLSRAALARVLSQLESLALDVSAGPVLDEEVVADLLSTRRRSGETLLAYLLPKVDGDMQRDLAQARAQLSGRDFAGLARTAHALAGHAGLLGASAVAAAARELELLLEGSDSPTEARAPAEPDERVGRAARLLEACEVGWGAVQAGLSLRAARA